MYESSVKTFLSFIRKHKDTSCHELDEFGVEHLWGGSLKELFQEFGLYVVLLPGRKTKYVSEGRVLNVFAGLKKALVDRTDFKGYWGDVDSAGEPRWWGDLMKALRSAVGRNQVENDANPRTQPFYTYQIEAVALETLTKYVNVKEEAQDGLLVTLGFHGIGRSGECQYLMWDETFLYLEVQALVLTWKEGKNQAIYPMAMVAGKSFLSCPIHSLACYVCVGGLLRNRYENNDPEKICRKFVERATDPSKLVSSVLPEGYTGTSLRKGGLTTASNHPHISHHEVLVRSGHSFGDNSNFYISRTRDASARAGRAMLGYVNHRQTVHLPFVEEKDISLDNQDELVHVLFSNGVPSLNDSSRADILRYLLYSLIQHYDGMGEIEIAMPANRVQPIREKLRKAVTRVVEGCEDTGTAHKFLTALSKKVHSYYILNNAPAAIVSERDDAQLVNALSAEVAECRNIITAQGNAIAAQSKTLEDILSLVQTLASNQQPGNADVESLKRRNDTGVLGNADGKQKKLKSIVNFNLSGNGRKGGNNMMKGKKNEHNPLIKDDLVALSRLGVIKKATIKVFNSSYFPDPKYKNKINRVMSLIHTIIEARKGPGLKEKTWKHLGDQQCDGKQLDEICTYVQKKVWDFVLSEEIRVGIREAGSKPQKVRIAFIGMGGRLDKIAARERKMEEQQLAVNNTLFNGSFGYGNAVQSLLPGGAKKSEKE